MISGGGGNDLICAGKGIDAVQAGEGNDRVDLGAARHAPYVRQSARGGSDDDHLIGANTADRLLGGPGDDHIRGKRGRDLIPLGPGNDFIRGSRGTDYLSFYSRQPVDLRVNLTRGFATGVGADRLESVENVTVFARGFIKVRGNGRPNRIRGSSGARQPGKAVFIGGRGDDRLNFAPGTNLGIAGHGYLFGGGGDDRLDNGCTDGWVDRAAYGGSGNDRMDLGCGTNAAHGGAGDDVFLASGDRGPDVVSGADGTDTIHMSGWGQGAEAHLDEGWASYRLASGDSFVLGGKQHLSSIENVLGHRNPGNYASDLLIGDDVTNVISGVGGQDTIEGKGGDDVLDGGNGSDFVNGGDGTDTCRKSEKTVNCEQ
jgi:Ca2+-binding RTX toxin-like protein